MAVHIWRNRRDEHAAETRTEAPPRTARRRLWPARRTTAAAHDPQAPATAPPARPVVVRRGPRRWPRSNHNPVSRMILGLAWGAVLILGLGMLLTLTNANPGNELVAATLDSGRWLATPFHDVFTNPDPDHQLYMNWGLAAVIYYLLGRGLSWLTRF